VPDQFERALEIALARALLKSKMTPARVSGTSSRTRSTFTRALCQVDVDLFQFIFDLARVAAGEKDEKLERVAIKLQLPLFRARLDHLGRFFLPTAAARIEFLENLKLGAFGERFVKRASFIDFDCADQKNNFRSKTGVDRFSQLFERRLDRGRARFLIVTKKIRVFSQTNFSPPKNGKVRSASIVDLILAAAWSALSAAPSIVSRPNSPASFGFNFSPIPTPCVLPRHHPIQRPRKSFRRQF